MKDQIKHCAKIAADNARWHREKFRETQDRYHLGQWKAYSRVAKRLKTWVYNQIPNPPKRILTEEAHNWRTIKTT